MRQETCYWPSPNRDPEWIELEEAQPIIGRKTNESVRQFVKDWNNKKENADRLILRIPGRVDKPTLRAAMRIMMERHTPGMDLRKQLSNGRERTRLVRMAR